MSDEPRLAKLQKFTTVRMPRSAINPAPYNPRKIDAYAKKKLTKALKKQGLIETLVVNKRTGVLISGHQRLSILDESEKDQEYALDVAVVDVDEKTEKELNVLMNNGAVQGQYDEDALAGLMRSTEGFDIGNAGFDTMDLAVILDSPNNADIFELNKQNEKLKETVAGVDALAEKKVKTREDKAAEIAKIKEAKKAHREAAREKDDAKFIGIVVFKDAAEKEIFLNAMGADTDYVDGARVLAALGLSLTPDTPDAA